MTKRLMIKKRRRGQNRSGATTVEMAFCLPVLFLMFLGSIDLIRYNLLRNIVSQATYQAARTGSVKGATIADVQAKVAEEMAKFGNGTDYTLTTSPTSLPSTQETLTITLESNIRSSGWILSNYITGSTMSETMTVKLE